MQANLEMQGKDVWFKIFELSYRLKESSWKLNYAVKKILELRVE